MISSATSGLRAGLLAFCLRLRSNVLPGGREGRFHRQLVSRRKQYIGAAAAPPSSRDRGERLRVCHNELRLLLRRELDHGPALVRVSEGREYFAADTEIGVPEVGGLHGIGQRQCKAPKIFGGHGVTFAGIRLGQANSRITASTARLSPFLAKTALMVPSRSARSTFSIFMASTTASVSPALTSWPGATEIETTRPGIGHRTFLPVSTATLAGINRAAADSLSV